MDFILLAYLSSFLWMENLIYFPHPLPQELGLITIGHMVRFPVFCGIIMLQTMKDDNSAQYNAGIL